MIPNIARGVTRNIGSMVLVFVLLLVGLRQPSYTQCVGGSCYRPPSFVVPLLPQNFVQVTPDVTTKKAVGDATTIPSVARRTQDVPRSWVEVPRIIARKEDEFVSKDFSGPGNRRVRTDMPMRLYIRNTGGSDGSGLCVFTSIYHVGVYNGLPLLGYRRFMERRPGGGWPEKVDKTLKDYCTENGVPVPRYAHAYRMASLGLVEAALARGHMVCITWGTDYSHYGGQTIAHMVNCVYLDSEWGCILDNNFPNEFLWVKRPTFDRYAAHSSGGGDSLWAIVFIDNPIPHKILSK